MAKVKKTDIKKDLLEQLEKNGTHGSQYLDLVDDYMAFYDIKNKLIADIKKRGVSVEYKNGQNQFGIKKNESINELNKTNAQMLRLLSLLGLDPSNVEAIDPGDEEL